MMRGRWITVHLSTRWLLQVHRGTLTREGWATIFDKLKKRVSDMSNVIVVAGMVLGQLRMRLKCTTTYNERDGNIRGQLRDIKQRMLDIDRQQSQEESLRSLAQNDHVGEQIEDVGSLDQSHNGVWNGPRPAPVHEHYGERGISVEMCLIDS